MVDWIGDIRLRILRIFKGRESVVVIVAGVQSDDEQDHQLMYTACTRAQAHLIVIRLDDAVTSELWDGAAHEPLSTASSDLAERREGGLNV